MEQEIVQSGTAGEDMQALYAGHRSFFDSGKTFSYTFRREQLQRLNDLIGRYEKRLEEAMYADMKKPSIEAFGGEIGFVKKEIRYTLRHLKSWMRDDRVPTALAHWPTRSWIQYRPKGVVLILSPWNYPFNLLFTPLVGAMAAGNCAILKPSEQAPYTAAVIEEMITEHFDPGYISVVRMPGREVIPSLIRPFRFDHIFFTGSEPAGREVYAAAAKHLTPVTLELGGKSPGLVLPDAHFDLAAKRIAFGKFFNGGQTCVAPDYALVPVSREKEFIGHLVRHIGQFYGSNPLHTTDMTGIINEARFDHLVSRLEGTEIVHGGRHDRANLRIEPTIVRTDPGHPLMQEEIFGPILPVMAYKDEDHALDLIHQNPHPLAFYLFTKSERAERRWLKKFAFGGGGVNTALVHVANTDMPFGGVVSSGMGRYHGKYSFDLFSYAQSISKTSLWPDVFLRYPPYTSLQQKLARWLYG